MRRALLTTIVLMTSALVWTASVVALRASWALAGELDHASPLAEIGAHPQSTVVFDRQNKQAFSFFVEQRADVRNAPYDVARR